MTWPSQLPLSTKNQPNVACDYDQTSEMHTSTPTSNLFEENHFEILDFYITISLSCRICQKLTSHFLIARMNTMLLTI